MAGTPAEYSAYQPSASADQGQNADQGQYAEQGQSAGSAGVFGGIFGPGDCGPRWIFAAETVVIQRSAPRHQFLFTDRSGTLNNDPIDAKNTYFPMEFGPQVSAVRRLPCDWEFEAAYFQVDGFDAQAIVPGAGTLVTDATSGFAVTDSEFRYTSALHWGELNLRRQWNDWLNLLVGFRMGELAEHYHAGGMGARNPVPVSLDVNAFNHLYGIQLGANAEVYNMGGPLRISALCKAAALGNSASQDIRRAQDEGRLSDEHLSAQTNQWALYGEAGGVLTYALTTHIAFRASVEAAWLESVALAPEQIGATNFTAGPTGTTHVDAGGGIFYYGGGVGIECRY